MHWTGWIVVALLMFTGGWMAFDGSRALIVGDYVTPQSGPKAGQLGPWAKVVEMVGIAPRSTLMKVLLAGYGVVALLAGVGFAIAPAQMRNPVLVVAVLGLWYLPIGTLANAIVLILIWLPTLR